MRLINCLFAISLLGFLAGCTKEVVEPNYIIVKRPPMPSNTFVLDTFVGAPPTWQRYRANEYWKRIYCDSIWKQDAVDAYFGIPGFEWINLPYVNMDDDLTINYFWDQGSIVFMAYGDSAKLADKNSTYWNHWKGYMHVKVTKNR